MPRKKTLLTAAGGDSISASGVEDLWKRSLGKSLPVAHCVQLILNRHQIDMIVGTACMRFGNIQPSASMSAAPGTPK